MVAASFSGLLAHLKRRSVDFRMGWVLLIGGLVGSTLGIWVFNLMRKLGQVDLVVQLSYVLFLGVIGLMMLNEGVRALRRSRHALPPTKRHHHSRVHGLPFKMKFRASGLYISALLPLGVGALVGLMAAIMGVGGGIIMVPAMIYLLGMPTKVVVGTSLFQVTALSAYTTMMHAVSYNTVDVMLAVLLIVGGVVGAQIGTQLGARLKAEQLRVLMALLVLAVCFKIALDLVLTPSDLFTLTPGVVK